MKATNEIQIFVIDDHAIFRESLVLKLNNQPGYKVVGELDNGSDAVEAVGRAGPDILLMDISLKGINGIDTVKLIRAANISCGIIMLSMHSDRGTIFQALDAGANGYVLKDDEFNHLVEGISQVSQHRRYISPSLDYGQLQASQEDSKSKDPVLTDREVEIVGMIANGMNTKEIANTLSVSAKTIENHRSNIYRKLSIKNTAELTRYAIRRGITLL